MKDEKAILAAAVTAAEDKKAVETELIDVKKVTSLSEYFMICTANSATHARALCDAVEKALKEKFQFSALHIEGYQDGNWILLDYGWIVVHIFIADTRRFYSIERLWSDAVRLDTEEVKQLGSAV